MTEPDEPDTDARDPDVAITRAADAPEIATSQRQAANPGDAAPQDPDVAITRAADAPEIATPGAAAAPPELPKPPLRTLLEAVLLVTDEPVPAATLAAVVEEPTPDVERVLSELAREWLDQERGFELRLVAGGWRLYTRPDCAPWVERFVLDGQSARLTQAALETLAVIAYRQPVTRARVSAVRGVNVDGVVRTLLARGLIAEAGQDTDTAGTLYRTTPLLLERLGLQSLEELPDLAPLLPELSELDEAQSSA